MARPADELSTAQKVRDELECPQCGYSLRGLPGDVVHCPECGHECNITAMMTRQWRGPWQRAPGFNRLVWPLAWLLIGGMVGLLLLAYDMALGWSGVVTTLSFAIVVMIWIWMLRSVRDVPTPGAGIGLALLAHVLFAGYIGGIVLIVMLLARAANSASGLLVAMFLGLMAVPIFMFWLMRRGEKYIARRCINAWVNRPVEDANVFVEVEDA